jgi:tripartite-type tricarboxylate transporter receptor subunit TctC
MSESRSLPTRRDTLNGLAAALAGGLAVPLAGPARAQAKFPTRKFSVIVPTAQGGGAERLARPFAEIWSKQLGQPFEFEFHPGAAGQVGYTLYVQKRERDGHNLLFGNMGPEMIMYATQKPAYKFPDDYIYFCRTDTDDSCVFVRKASPFKRIEDVVAEAKKRPLNTATSRIPHPASIGILALGSATGSRFNLIPYQGGNPTTIAVLSGEVDIGVLPITGIVKLTEQFRVLGVFNKENRLAKYSENAPSINAVFGTKIPDLYSARSWAVHTEFAAKSPEAFKLLEETARKVTEDPAYVVAAEKNGEVKESLTYGDRKSCTEYAMSMIALANEYQSILTAKPAAKKP